METPLARTIEQGAAWASFAGIAVKVIAVSNTFIVLSQLTVYQYGVAELALSVLGVMSIFLLPGIDKAVQADMGVEKGKGNVGGARRLLQDYFFLQLILSTIAFLILFFGSALVARFFTPEIGGFFKILALFFLISPFSTNLRILLGVQLDYFGQALYTLMQEALKLAVLVGIIVFSELTISGLLWAIAASQVFALVVLLPRAYSAFSFYAGTAPTGTFAPLTFITQHGKWTLFASYLDTFGKNARPWLIKFFLGTEAVGLFAVAQGLLGQLSSLLQINQVVAPLLPQYLHDRRRFYRIIEKAFKYQLLITVALIFAGFLLVPPFIYVVFPKYASSLPLFYILVFALIPASITSLFQTMFFALKAQKNLFFALIIKLIAVLALLPLFIYFFGIRGAAIEFVATTILFGLERYRVLKKLLPEFRIDFRNMLRFDDYDRALIERIRTKVPFLKPRAV